MKKFSNKAFTLIELMVAAAILLVTLVGILLSYVRSLELAELSKNSSIAVNAVRSRMEQIRNTQFSQILATYNNVTFTAAGFNGLGISYVTAVNADLLQVTISFSWRQSNRRVIGEDKDLDGVLDAGEDKNGNGILDSPVEIVSDIYNL